MTFELAIQGPSVEFFNPKMRRELDKRDEEIKRTTGKGGAPGGDDWTYLTSYSRVPVSIKQFYFSIHSFRKIIPRFHPYFSEFNFSSGIFCIFINIFNHFFQYDAITGFCKSTKEYCPPGPRKSKLIVDILFI